MTERERERVEEGRGLLREFRLQGRSQDDHDVIKANAVYLRSN